MDLNYSMIFPASIELFTPTHQPVSIFGKPHFVVDRSLLEVEADFSSGRPNVQYTKMQFSKERVSIFTQFSGRSSFGLILLDFTPVWLTLGTAKNSFSIFPPQTYGIYSKTQTDGRKKIFQIEVVPGGSEAWERMILPNAQFRNNHWGLSSFLPLLNGEWHHCS